MFYKAVMIGDCHWADRETICRHRGRETIYRLLCDISSCPGDETGVETVMGRHGVHAGASQTDQGTGNLPAPVSIPGNAVDFRIHSKGIRTKYRLEIGLLIDIV
jgi:hypothetical protein